MRERRKEREGKRGGERERDEREKERESMPHQDKHGLISSPAAILYLSIFSSLCHHSVLHQRLVTFHLSPSMTSGHLNLSPFTEAPHQ